MKLAFSFIMSAAVLIAALTTASSWAMGRKHSAGPAAPAGQSAPASPPAPASAPSFRPTLSGWESTDPANQVEADSSAQALLAIPAEGASAARAQLALDWLASQPEVLTNTAAFDEGERGGLRSLSRGTLSLARRLTVANAAAALRLEARARAQSIAATLEPAGVQLGMEADDDIKKQFVAPSDLGSLQWAVQNKGISQRLDIDDLTSVQVPGVAGEDIGVNRAPGEPMITAQGSKIIVAVLDTGIDVNHPDLKNQIVRHESECQKQREYLDCQVANSTNQSVCDSRFLTQDTDGNGYPLDCQGWNVATNTPNRTTGVWGNPDSSDLVGHGTHVAGIIGSAMSRLGTRGVMQNVQILPVKVIQSGPNSPVRPQSDETPTTQASPSASPSASPLPVPPLPQERTLRWTAGFTDLIARGMLYAIRNGANVVNMSMAWPAGADSALMRQMVKLAQDRGIVVVSSAGNDSSDARVMPCQYPGVICVASHGPDGKFSHFSNYGPFVDIAAPGLRILSTWPLDRRQINFFAYTGYEFKNGTSMAGPYVAGLAARLMSQGYSPRETYARLMLGARPTQGSALDLAAPDEAASLAPSRTGTPLAKFTRGGNADLPGALSVEPQALILPFDKQVVRLSWDRAASDLPIKLRLKNFWADAEHVDVQARLVADGGGAPGASLTTTQWAFDAWEADGVRELPNVIHVERAALEGRLSVEFTATVAGRAPRKFRIPVEISVAVGPAFAAEGTQNLRFIGATLPRGVTLRTVTTLDSRPAQDYLAIAVGLSSTIQILSEQSDSSYRVSAPVAFNVPQGGELMLIHRLDIDQSGDVRYAVIYRVAAATIGELPVFRFMILDSSGNTLRTSDYDNQKAALSDRFQWTRLRAAPSGLLTPTWIGNGLQPKLEKPAFDPWNPKPTDDPDFRIYYLADDGLRTVALPKKDLNGDFFPVDFISPTREQRSHGEVSILLSQGNGYIQKYWLATVQDAQLKNLHELALPQYRMLLGLKDKADVTPLSRTADLGGSVFSAPSAEGSLRGTAIFNGTPTLDYYQYPSQLTSSVIHSTGLFLSPSGSHVAVSQTQYDLMFTDLATGESRMTGLNRFSFLPSFISRNLFYPVVADGADAAGERIPGILIPASLGATDAAEILVPSRDAQGHLVAVSRPAWMRLTSSTGCDALANPIAADATAPTRLAFFCGDRILRLPIVTP